MRERCKPGIEQIGSSILSGLNRAHLYSYNVGDLWS